MIYRRRDFNYRTYGAEIWIGFFAAFVLVVMIVSVVNPDNLPKFSEFKINVNHSGSIYEGK